MVQPCRGLKNIFKSYRTYFLFSIFLANGGLCRKKSTETVGTATITTVLRNLAHKRSIDNSLYYSLNKINHKRCTVSHREGICMFVWECMKSGGQHGGMCMDGFMFGSCCTHNKVQDKFSTFSSNLNSSPGLSFSPSSSSSSSTTPDKFQSFGFFTTERFPSTPRVSYNKFKQKPISSYISSITLNTPTQSGYEHFPLANKWQGYTSPSNSISTFYPDLSSIEHHTTAKQELTTVFPYTYDFWTKDPSMTIKPPKPPTRPTRPPKPQRPVHHFTSLWSEASEIRPEITEFTTKAVIKRVTSTKPTTTTTTTTTTFSTTPSTSTYQTAQGTSSTVWTRIKDTFKGPATTNIHSSHVCGVRKMGPQPEGRIVNGTNSLYGEFPWQTSVRRTSFFGFSSTHRCGGALLNSQWVATAGHCVDDLLITHIRLRVGEYDFSTVSEPHPYEERKAKKKVVHPKYNFFTYEYDLALVKMESPVDFMPHIQPICLPGNQDLLIGEMAKVTGWGRLSEHGTLPSILQKASVPIMSNEKCQQMFLNGGRKEEIPKIFLCAGYPDGGRDSCQGDSGGPLQVKGADGRWFLAGIISWGIGCAEPNLPGVCTRISQFVPFILQHVTR